jgi:hypothetical protein
VIALLLAAAASGCGRADAPSAPTDVLLSASAGSVVVTWTPTSEGPTVDQYLVLRDGVELAELSSEEASYADVDVMPGTEYEYQLVAVTGSNQSEPTAMQATQTPAPSPADLYVYSAAADSFVLEWSPPPDSPDPDNYVILRNGDRIDTVPGTSTEYIDSGVALGERYRYRIAAMWGENLSKPSPAHKVKTFGAPLQQSWQVVVKNTITPGGTVKAGDKWRESWDFTPKCVDSQCPVRLRGSLGGHAFQVKLTREGDDYTGTTRAKITSCGTPLTPFSGPNVNNTLTFRLEQAKTDDNGLWISWEGLLQMHAPRTDSAGVPNPLAASYCPAQDWEFTLKSR